jgi:hypothetical protein
MRRLQSLFILCGIALAGGAALAQGIAWRTIRLDDGVAIDVPAAVADRARLAQSSKVTLMAFALNGGDPGTLSCQFMRYPYGKELARQSLVTALGKGDAGNFCKVAGSRVQGWQLGSADSDTTDGMPSGHCLSAYTDAGQQQAGKVMTVKMVAGARNAYQLLCVSAFDDRDGAVTAYATRWNDIVNRMQQSLHLPAAEK